MAQQTHLIYATNTGRWWLFWIDSATPSVLNTSSSPDFQTWSAGPTLNLPLSHESEGRNFSVDYASIAGTDVVHLALSLVNSTNNKDRRHYHARAALGAGGAVTFGTVSQLTMVNDPQLTDPDGTVTRIGTDAKVTDVSGWAMFMMGGGTGNESAWTSTMPDTGAAGGVMFGVQDDIYKAPLTIHSRAIVALSGGVLIGFWDAAESNPEPHQRGLQHLERHHLVGRRYGIRDDWSLREHERLGGVPPDRHGRARGEAVDRRGVRAHALQRDDLGRGWHESPCRTRRSEAASSCSPTGRTSCW